MEEGGKEPGACVAIGSGCRVRPCLLARQLGTPRRAPARGIEHTPVPCPVPSCPHKPGSGSLARSAGGSLRWIKQHSLSAPLRGREGRIRALAWSVRSRGSCFNTPGSTRFCCCQLPWRGARVGTGETRAHGSAAARGAGEKSPAIISPAVSR